MIPSSKADFSSKDYWTAFFKHNKSAHFQWYLEVSQLLPIITKEAATLDIKNARVCIPGNGDSLLGASLASQGYKVDALDFDPGVVKRMSQANKFQNLKYLERDITSLDYEEPSYDLIIDKGSLDALYSDQNEENKDKATKYLEGAVRGIKHRGKFIIVSLLQPHILDLILSHFFSENQKCCFIPRLYQVIETPESSEESKEAVSDLTKFIKFVFIFEIYSQSDLSKVRALFGSKTTFQTVLPNGDFSKPQIYKTLESVRATIVKRQKLGLALSGIKHFRPFQHFSLQISAPSQSQGQLPLYNLTILDTGDPVVYKKKTALVVVVPLGMEKGKNDFVRQCGFTRVIIVQRSIGFPSDETKVVQQDLKDMIGDLIPFECVNSSDLPFTTVPSKGGKRVLLGEVENYRVFEYMNEDLEVFRECVSSEGQIVGENRVLRKGKPKSKKQKEMWENSKHLATQSPFLEKDKNHHVYISASHLLSSYHRAALLSSLHFSDLLSNPEASLNILIVGLGGGAQLPSFLGIHFMNCKIFVLEDNAAQIEIAKKYFQFQTNERLKLLTSQAELSQVTQEKGFNFLIFEQNSKLLHKRSEIISKYCDPKGIALLPSEEVGDDSLAFTKRIKLDQGCALIQSNCEIQVKAPSFLKGILDEAVLNEIKFYQRVE